MHQDYTDQGRRPTAAQIVSAWKRGGRPAHFTVAYGETFAEFEHFGGRWNDSGNGCRGVQRDKVVAALATDVPAAAAPVLSQDFEHHMERARRLAQDCVTALGVASTYASPLKRNNLGPLMDRASNVERDITALVNQAE